MGREEKTLYSGAFTVKADSDSTHFALLAASCSVDAAGAVRLMIRASPENGGAVEAARDAADLVLTEAEAAALAKSLHEVVTRLEQLRALHRSGALKDDAHVYSDVGVTDLKKHDE